MKRFPAVVAVVAGLAMLAGCATPSDRIKRYPELFEQFPPEVQQNVKAGRIDIGYTKEMIFIALGQPDRKYVKTTADGKAEVWAYTDRYTTIERVRVNGGFLLRNQGSCRRTVTDYGWADVFLDHEYDRVRVEFRDDQAVAIERLEPNPQVSPETAAPR